MEEENKITEDEMINIAKEANTIITSKDKEISDLKLKLARNELYREAPVENIPKFDPTVPFNPLGKTNLEIAEHITNVHDYNRSKNKPSPLAPDQKQADQIAAFYKKVITLSDGSPEDFLFHYGKQLGNDTAESKAAYDKFKINI